MRSAHAKNYQAYEFSCQSIICNYFCGQCGVIADNDLGRGCPRQTQAVVRVLAICGQCTHKKVNT
jgi:hypothetical protein